MQESIWLPDSDRGNLSKEEIEALESIIPSSDGEKNEGSKDKLTLQSCEAMLEHMRRVAEKMNSNNEICRNGFQYPMVWLDDFERIIKNKISAEEVLDIGIIGYGSLQSSKSAASVLDSRSTEFVKMKGIRRGLYFSGFARTKKEWEHMGMDYNVEQAIMGIKYDPNSECNGVRMPLPLDDISKLGQREWAYELLPGPPAESSDSKSFALNLVCWPLGRSLMNQLKNDQVQDKIESLKLAKENVHVGTLTREQMQDLFDIKTTDDQKKYLKRLREQGREQSDNDGELEMGITNAYNTRMDKLYDLGERPLPNMAYVHTCLNIGDPTKEEEFLDTTYCYNRAGEEILLRDYLKHYAPKTNPKVRAGGSAVDGSDVDRERSKSVIYMRPQK